MNSIQELYNLFEKNEYGYSTDTRNVTKGDLFFCLVGEKYDANLFAEDALNKGAAVVVTNREDLRGKTGYFHSDNPLITFQELAKWHASIMPAKIVIIGGSNGKTTTKELVYAVLNSQGATHVTAGNYNNHVGVPITLLGIRSYHQYAVIEMGTNHPGEMKTLCSLVTPEIGVITNIGKEHLEGFGDIEAVAKEESEVFLRLIECAGTAVVNLDDPWINSMSKRIQKKYGVTLKHKDSNASLNDFIKVHEAKIHAEMPSLVLEFNSSNESANTVEFSIAGSYNAYNILFGLAIGQYFGISQDDCLVAMQQYSPKNNRSEWRTVGETQIFLDAYNANPSSMEAAIRSFHTLPGTKVYLLGDMLELGAHSESEHLQLLALLQELNIMDCSFLVGEEFYKYCSTFPCRFTDTNSLLAWLDTHPIQANYVFIKGSRGIKMENVLEHFKP